MTWTDRQLAMLREMGIRLWPAQPSPAGASTHDEPLVAVAEAEPEVRSIGAHVDAAMAGIVAERAELADRAVRPSQPAQNRAAPIEGVYQASWMIVGDAPGEADERSVLTSGTKQAQLLDNMLMACGLDRQATPSQPEKQVFLTYAMEGGPAGGNPAPGDVAAYGHRLLRLIEAVQPKVVVAMGRIAAQSLLRSTDPIGKLRGRVHQAQGAAATAVVVTYPTAYLLRNPQDKARAWEDLCLAMSVVKAPAG